MLDRQNTGCPISGIIALAVLHFVSSSELLGTTCMPLECLAFSSVWVIGRVYIQYWLFMRLAMSEDDLVP